MTSKKIILVSALLTALFTTLYGCSGAPQPYRANCAEELSRAWADLDLAKAEGFAGTVSYTKAFSLITAAKSQQTIENFDDCVSSAKKAQFYISESRHGR